MIWDVTSFSLVDVHFHFGTTPVDLYSTTACHIPDKGILDISSALFSERLLFKTGRLNRFI
jgi:hypothetical protein